MSAMIAVWLMLFYFLVGLPLVSAAKRIAASLEVIADSQKRIASATEVEVGIIDKQGYRI